MLSFIWICKDQLWATGKGKCSPPFLVWTAGHMGPHKIDWFTKPAQVPREFELAAYQFECDPLDYWAILNTLYGMWQSDKGMARGFSDYFSSTYTFQVFGLHNLLTLSRWRVQLLSWDLHMSRSTEKKAKWLPGSMLNFYLNWGQVEFWSIFPAV